VDSDDAALLHDTVDTFRWPAQYAVDHAFQGEYVPTSKTTLDDETYDDVREKTDGFNGGLVQAARNKAAEASKTVVQRWKQAKKASKPSMTSPHAEYLFSDGYEVTGPETRRMAASHPLQDGRGVRHVGAGST